MSKTQVFPISCDHNLNFLNQSNLVISNFPCLIVFKSILAAMPTYFLIVFKMPKWGISNIDKFRISFPWKGQDPENIKGGHCLVNWLKCTRPKSLGGLRLEDLENFNRALRMRWLWHHWDQVEKPWKHLLKITDQVERQLFFSSTLVNIGDGKNTPFWETRWLNGMAPNLFNCARFKKRTIHTKIQNCNWIRNLNNINSSALIEEFTLLFMALAEI
jgi:hypothetical protein